MIKFILISILYLGMFVPSVTFAGTYYVASDGSASWANSTNISTPCPAATAMTNADAGDTVYFRGGTYSIPFEVVGYDHSILEPTNSGSIGSPITFVNYSDEVPTLDLIDIPTDDYNEFVIGSNGKDYIIWDGFTLLGNSGTFMAGICVFDGDNCELKNLTINGGDPDITFNSNADAIRIEGTDDTLISKCKIYNWTNGTDDANTTAIKLYANNRIIIENCEIDNVSGGIYMKATTNDSIIRYNWINNASRGIYAQVYSDRESNDNIIHNNLITNSRWASFYTSHDEGVAEMDGWEIYNNTIYDAVKISKAVWVSKGQDTKFYNNIIQGDYDGQIVFRTGCTVLESDHNNFGSLDFYIFLTGTEYTSLATWQSSSSLQESANPGVGSLTSDPLFVNISGNRNQIYDFDLDPGSPCKATGRDSADMGADISLVGRLSAGNLTISDIGVGAMTIDNFGSGAMTFTFK